MTSRAVIFDVDGVLLDLSEAEEDVFFAAFAPWGDPASLPRDWNSYRIRNDDNIVDEIMERWRIPPREKPGLVSAYHRMLEEKLSSGSLRCPVIAGAEDLLSAQAGESRLGIATANFREAARLRLGKAGLWHHVAGLACGADGGGHKHEILARAIAASGLAPSRIVYIGDNLNDVEAGIRNAVHFIGFSTSPERRASLTAAGATRCTGSHDETLVLVRSALSA